MPNTKQTDEFTEFAKECAKIVFDICEDVAKHIEKAKETKSKRNKKTPDTPAVKYEYQRPSSTPPKETVTVNIDNINTFSKPSAKQIDLNIAIMKEYENYIIALIDNQLLQRKPVIATLILANAKEHMKNVYSVNIAADEAIIHKYMKNSIELGLRYEKVDENTYRESLDYKLSNFDIETIQHIINEYIKTDTPFSFRDVLIKLNDMMQDIDLTKYNVESIWKYIQEYMSQCEHNFIMNLYDRSYNLPDLDEDDLDSDEDDDEPKTCRDMLEDVSEVITNIVQLIEDIYENKLPALNKRISDLEPNVKSSTHQK